MTMIELMIALVVFAIASTAIVAGLLATMQSTRSSRNRLQASSLAAREMEILRNEFNSSAATALALGAANLVTNPHPLPGGTVGADLTVDGSPYKLVRNVEWLPAGTGKTACDGGAALTYPSLAVNVSVSWPRMGEVKPVVSNTVLTPRKNTLASDLSFVGVKVVDVASAPVSGQTVTLTGPGGPYTDMTAADGCAIFALTNTGDYTASLNTGGMFVDRTGSTNPTQPVPVPTKGVLIQKTFNYDRAATTAVTLTTATNFFLPTSKPQITLYNTGIQPLGVKSFPSAAGGATSITGLWPYVDGYSYWAGSCKQSDPIVAAPPPAVPLGVHVSTGLITPGSTTLVNVPLAPVWVQVNGATTGTTTTLTASPASSTSCVAPDGALILGSTTTGVLKTSLPAGRWTITATTATQSGTAVTGILLPTTPAPVAPSVTVAVN